MQAILVKFLGATGSRGSRLKATAASGSITIPYPHELREGEEAAHAAADALRVKLGWQNSAYGRLIGGQLPDGSWVFVFAGSLLANPRVTTFASNPRRRKGSRRQSLRAMVRAGRRRSTTARRPKSRGGVRVAGTLSREALEIRYVHATDGDRYVHKFKKGVTIQFLSDGSARFYRPDGRPLWRNFKDR
jgi:hypothetical protein